MYVKIVKDNIEKYPYTVSDLLNDNPSVSFPKYPSDELLIEWGVHRVIEQPLPQYNKRTQKVEKADKPELIEGKWFLTWYILEKTLEEIASYDNKSAEFIREERNKLLRDTDWRALSDNILEPAWAAYRQSLRDITEQENFPISVNWPAIP